MYMNLKPNQHKRISFNTTTMTSLGVHSPPPPLLLNLAPPLNVIFCSEIFRYPPKIGGGGGRGCYHVDGVNHHRLVLILSKNFNDNLFFSRTRSSVFVFGFI